MSDLWCGGEDIDFETVSAAPTVDTDTDHFDPNLSRCALIMNTNGDACSEAFSGGGVLSAYLSWYGRNAAATIERSAHIGLGVRSGGDTYGIFMGNQYLTIGRLEIIKRDSGGQTVLAASVASDVFGPNLHRYTLRIDDYGDASAYVAVYRDGVLVVDYTGDITCNGVSSLNRVLLHRYYNSSYMSQMIVSDEENFRHCLNTRHITGAGSANEWDAGTYADIDEVTNNDADSMISNVNGADAQFALNNAPTGVYSSRAIKVIARAWKSADSTPSKLKLGILSEAVADLDSGQTIAEAADSYERLMTTINGGAITTSIMDSAELAIQAAA